MKKRSNKKKGFTLVEIMIVVLIIGILLAIAVPNFITARTNSRAQSIIATLNQVEAAKDQCGMDQGLTTGDSCPDILVYLKSEPEWPIQGTFEEGAIGTAATFNGKTAGDWKTDKSGL